jgi:DMSO/TMAO reductase YedYZ molybdopterin-dependent catalytic subunit
MRPKHAGPDQRPLVERVQRIVDGDVPILHLEPEMPTGRWDVIVDGAVTNPVEVSMDHVHGFDPIKRYIDLHCVWGWSRPDCAWEGVHLNALISGVEPSPDARYLLVTARNSPYASCVTLEEARDGIFAWRLDGRDIGPDRGWPLRFVTPGYKWAYKSVKWVERITFLESFEPGMWEERVGDPKGNVPWDVLQRFNEQSEVWRRGGARGVSPRSNGGHRR